MADRMEDWRRKFGVVRGRFVL
jgi:hypothetical protein